MASATEINNLLNDKLFQVIGSTPASIAENLLKIDLRGKKGVGIQIFAVAIFAAAVNKATLETFLADARFATVRPLLTSALSIQGKANMTALTLLGHCFLATDFASNVIFASEFRRKMGQDHLWAGQLESGSLSDVQKKILKEKQRVTNADDAKALGNGFLKYAGIIAAEMTRAERAMFKVTSTRTASATSDTAGNVTATTSRPVPDRSATSISDPPVSPTARPGNVDFQISNSSTVSIPEDVIAYRRDVLGQTNDEIAESIARNGEAKFISNTRTLAARDPTGKGVRNASVAGT